MAPPTQPAWFPSKRTPETVSAASITRTAPPAEDGLCPGRFTRLPVRSPPSIATAAERTRRAPARLGDVLPRKEQLRNRASAATTVTPPATLPSSLWPLRKTIRSKTTRLPRPRSELTNRTSGRSPPPSIATAAPAAARTVKPLRSLAIWKPFGGEA